MPTKQVEDTHNRQQDKYVQVLSSSQGNILEDEAAVNVLQEAKAVSDDVTRKQRAAEKTEAAIDEARTSYQPLAAYVRVLFFCVADMAAVDPMYQYSLAYFVSLFLRSIEAAERAKGVQQRLANLKEHFTFFLYTNVCRSLFEAHKLLFAFNLSAKLALAQGTADPAHFAFLLTGGIGGKDPGGATPAPVALPDKVWGELCRLSSLGGKFSGLAEAVAAAPAPWLECAPRHSVHVTHAGCLLHVGLLVPQVPCGMIVAHRSCTHSCDRSFAARSRATSCAF